MTDAERRLLVATADGVTMLMRVLSVQAPSPDRERLRGHARTIDQAAAVLRPDTQRRPPP